MNRREVLMGASASGLSVTTMKVSAATFGAVGDGIADDAPAIQAALDHLGRHGGGTLLLPQPSGHYRITKGLLLPSHVVLEGTAPVRYPFNAGNEGVCALLADFVNPRQWMLEAETRSGKRSIAVDQVIGGPLPDGVTYNCGVRNLLLTSRGQVPFGGIRMQGCPGSFVDGVSIDRTGCGLLVNHCSGGEYRVNVRSLYYGVAAWDDANANTFQVYCAQSTPWPRTVPPEYRLPFMQQMTGHFVDTLKFSTEDHASRPYGILCGSIASTSIGNVFDAVVEQFVGGIFLYNAYATDFRQCYLESETERMACAIAASRSRFSAQALHAYLSGSGAIFDFGINVMGKVFASGIIDAASFGKPPVDDGASRLLLEGIDPEMPGAPAQRQIRYAAAKPDVWLPLSLRSQWRASDGGGAPAAKFDAWSHRVELKGSMIGGAEGECFVLPPSCRPPEGRRYMIPGGLVDISPDGVGWIKPDGGPVRLDSIAFSRW